MGSAGESLRLKRIDSQQVKLKAPNYFERSMRWLGYYVSIAFVKAKREPFSKAAMVLPSFASENEVKPEVPDHVKDSAF